MTLTVFLAVLLAAMLHASWNALVKGGQDKNLAMTAVVLGHTPLALIALLFVPLPRADALIYVVFGILLHIGYQFFLMASYRLGDLTQVYPIARGIAPLLVTGISVVFLKVDLGRYGLYAVLLIACGIISLSLVRQSDGHRNHKAVLTAVVTGCFIAGYSLVDGLGARVAGSPLGYYGAVAIGNTIVFSIFMAFYQPGLLRDIPRKAKGVFWIGGSASYIAYAIVIWAFTQAPIALVTALRETSIIFALLIGVFFLREKLNLGKVFSTFVTLLGAALLRLNR